MFWLLNISALLVFQTSVFMVSVVSDIASTGDFSFYHRLFSIMVFLHSSAIMPLWPKFTHAKEKGDFDGMKELLKKVSVLTILYFGLGIVAITFGGAFLVKIWSGRDVVANNLTVISLSLWALFYGWLNVFGVFLNGIGKIRNETIMLTVAAILIYPLTYFCAKRVGMAGVPLAGAIILMPMVILLPCEALSFLGRRNVRHHLT
jgi:O-antigen/teichoic acid export membrane protein